MSNHGGYSKDITGQFRLTVGSGLKGGDEGVRSKTLKINVKDNEIDFFETYVVK